MKKMSIEALLTWAFTQELPKLGAGGGGSFMAASNFSFISEVAVLGTIIDRSPNHFGVIPGYLYEGDPSSDALAVGNAVNELADRGGLEIDAGWYPFPEWADPQGLVRGEVDKIAAEQRQRNDRLTGRHVVNLVISSAMLGRGPIWTADEPETEFVRGANGRDVWFVTRWSRDRVGKRYSYEDNGYDAKRCKPKSGAYRKYRLAHSVRGATLSRLDWQLWQSALEALHESLRSRLSDHTLLEFHPDRHPWVRVRNHANKGSSI